ncbi:MAG: phosphoribosylglycinamide formyltransferase [Clostridiaceae bacterium]|jgi:phosphoribosylglycinamide formyltransferase-1|nr:phosphoribosylglycinamide formyltransferase [Clostridiaceae bacterium]
MIGVMTYNVPHRKTYDVLCRLKAGGYQEVVVISSPFHYQKKFTSLIEHRPKTSNQIPIDTLCSNFGYQLFETFESSPLQSNDIVLLCGAGIIDKETRERFRFINSHPGYLPNVRGLDALKWAIYGGEPIGVTTHQLGDEVDSGLLIERVLLDIYQNDTFHAVAQRQYEMEVEMLVTAIEKIDDASEYIKSDGFPLHKRMSRSYELQLFEKFEAIIKNISIVSDKK